MCNFLSVLIAKNGDVLHHPMLDSHADLVTYFHLPDTSVAIQHFAKAECVPPSDGWLTPDTWRWHLDEPSRPVWLTEDLEREAEAATRRIAQRMILSEGEHRLIVDRCWIVGGTAVVRDVRGGRLICVWGSAQIHDVRDSAQLDASARAHIVLGGPQ